MLQRPSLLRGEKILKVAATLVCLELLIPAIRYVVCRGRVWGRGSPHCFDELM